ncbi:sugar-binding transcriptional regulator [Peptacetobacter sp.]|uniref:sugar-binding transcriptional regulator n=1 Tax=Peptacetobacter sp. TaxID=2991975 RepID=UPI00261C097B|nr:sugar-binding domain-containing protein [Peptacetobacter sp.]
MKNLIEIQKKLIPHAIELMERRYIILRQISLSQPIGRRSLSNRLGISERVTRTETEFLKEQGLICVAVSGMTITEEGEELLLQLKDIMVDIMGITNLQNKVREKLGIKKVIVVPRSCEDNEAILKDVAKEGSEYFLDILKNGNKISITGGTTMLEFADSVKTEKKYKDTLVLPARGSMGTDVDTQSNSVTARLGKNIHSEYELLHIPDELDESAIKTLSQIPEIDRTLKHISETDILVFSIGRADVMANRRNLDENQKKIIIENGAVGEAFGHYFDKNGDLVYKLNTVGIDLETYKKVKENILIFAGVEKVEAFMAVSEINKNLVLITDEQSAQKILEYNK